MAAVEGVAAGEGVVEVAATVGGQAVVRCVHRGLVELAGADGGRSVHGVQELGGGGVEVAEQQERTGGDVGTEGVGELLCLGDRGGGVLG